MAECAFSSSRRMHGDHAVARKWENVVVVVTRKIAIHNSLLDEAGGTRRGVGTTG